MWILTSSGNLLNVDTLSRFYVNCQSGFRTNKFVVRCSYQDIYGTSNSAEFNLFNIECSDKLNENSIECVKKVILKLLIEILSKNKSKFDIIDVSDIKKEMDCGKIINIAKNTYLF